MNDKLGSLNYINSLSISQNGAMLVMTSFGKVYELMDHYGACNKLSISECFPVSYHASHDSRDSFSSFIYLLFIIVVTHSHHLMTISVTESVLVARPPILFIIII